MNSINIVGRLVRDPETFNKGSGVKFTLADSIKFRNKSGETTEETCFIDVTSFVAVDAIAKHKKGQLIGVTGRLKHEQWEKDGQKHSKHSILVREITFIPNGKKDEQETGPEENWND